MLESLKKATKLSAVALSMGLLVGCAATGQGDLAERVEAVEDEAIQAQNTAQEALSKAEAAMNAATEAKEMASDAAGLAKAAQFTADRNEQRIERAFKQSMYK